MTQTFITASPQNLLADLFLENVQIASGQHLYSNNRGNLNETFSQILDQQFQTSEKNQVGSLYSDVNSATLDSVSSRRNALEELEKQAEQLGVPLDSFQMNQEDLPRLAQVLRESGLDDDQVSQVMSELSDGPLTMDRIMASLSGLKSSSSSSASSLKLSESSIPLFGQFLTDLGFQPDEVKNILAKMKPGQSFGAQDIQDIITKLSGQNMKGLDLSQADPDNLKDFLLSIGVGEEDANLFLSKIQEAGSVSLQSFTGILKSLDRPSLLDSSQTENIRQLIANLTLKNSLSPEYHFDRVLSMLSAMGDQDIDEDFLANNPAIQALRSGALTADKAAQGSGSMGGQDLGDSGFKGQGPFGSSLSSASGARAKADAGFASRLSQNVAQQVAEKMVYQVRNGQHRLQLQLTPPDLGKIQLNLVVKNHTVQATVISENPVVKEALEEQLAQLRQTLAQQGLELTRFDVLDGSGQQRQSETSDRKGRSFSLNSSTTTKSGADGGTSEEVRGQSQVRGLVDRMV